MAQSYEETIAIYRKRLKNAMRGSIQNLGSFGTLRIALESMIDMHLNASEVLHSHNLRHIDQAIKCLENSRDEIAIAWEVSDVMEFDEDLTEAEAAQILYAVYRDHDAEAGICWDTIEMHVEMFNKDNGR